MLRHPSVPQRPYHQSYSDLNSHRSWHCELQLSRWSGYRKEASRPYVRGRCPQLCKISTKIFMYAHLAYVQVEQQRNFAKAQQELQSLTARYRGPLLEAVVDLENRLWHLANATSEWQNSEGKLRGSPTLHWQVKCFKSSCSY